MNSLNGNKFMYHSRVRETGYRDVVIEAEGANSKGRARGREPGGHIRSQAAWKRRWCDLWNKMHQDFSSSCMTLNKITALTRISVFIIVLWWQCSLPPSLPAVCHALSRKAALVSLCRHMGITIRESPPGNRNDEIDFLSDQKSLKCLMPISHQFEVETERGYTYNGQKECRGSRENKLPPAGLSRQNSTHKCLLVTLRPCLFQ